MNGLGFTHEKLKAHTYYKYVIVALNGDDALAISKTIHVATKGGKVGNYTEVRIADKSVTLNVGKTFRVQAEAKAAKGAKVKRHRKIAYESNDINVATVTKAGKVKAKGKGACHVYVYAQDGRFAQVKVEVK